MPPTTHRGRSGRFTAATASGSAYLVERFFEMVFCSTSILMFLSLYYIIDEKIPEVSVYWQKYQDFILLIFLACSVILNGWLDRALVPLRCITADQKASIRLVSSFYIVLILLYIKFIYLDDNYDALILYFITLAVGRFIYFDFTWHDFCSTVHGVLINLPLLALMGCYSAFVCWYGFHTDFLLTSNGVILSTLLAHLFMDASIISCLTGRDCYSSFYKAVGPFIQNTFFLWI